MNGERLANMPTRPQKLSPGAIRSKFFGRLLFLGPVAIVLGLFHLFTGVAAIGIALGAMLLIDQRIGIDTHRDFIMAPLPMGFFLAAIPELAIAFTRPDQSEVRDLWFFAVPVFGAAGYFIQSFVRYRLAVARLG